MKESKQEEKNRLRNQMRSEVLEPEECECKYNIGLFSSKLDLDCPDMVQVSIPRRIDHWLRNWAKDQNQLVSKRLEMFLKLNGLDRKLSGYPDRPKNADPHSIRWHLKNKNMTREEAVESMCTLYKPRVSEDLWEEYLKQG
jgi:hypothetical protein